MDLCSPHIRKLRTICVQIECKIYFFSEFVLVRLGKVRPGKISGSAAGVPELNARPHMYTYNITYVAYNIGYLEYTRASFIK